MASTTTKTIQANSSVTTPASNTATEFISTATDPLGLPAVKRSDGSVVSPLTSVSGTSPIVITGSSTISINPATDSTPGSLSAADKTKLDSMASGASVSSVGGTLPITSSGGATPTIAINAATDSTAGSMSAADKTKLDGIGAGATVVSVTASAPVVSSGGISPNITLTVTPAGATTAVGSTRNINTTAPLTGGSTLGTDLTLAISPATDSTAGSLSAADKTKLDTVTSGAAVASVGGSAPIVSSGGTAPTISINAATDSTSGSMSAADKTKLDGMTAGAAVASVSGTAPIVSSGGTSPAISISPATDSTAGSLSASDKTKLDSMASGAAVASVTASAPIVSSGGVSPNITATVSPAGATTLVGTTRNINTTAPIVGGGSLAADLTLSINSATTTSAGSMSSVDKKRMSQIYDAQADFGFVGDLITTNATSSMVASSNILTDSSNPFLSTDVGKRITVPRTGAGTSPNIAQLTTTITGFNSAGSVTLGASSTNAVTNVSVSYGTDNTAAITTMQNTVNNAAFPGTRIIFGESATNAYGFPTPINFTKQVHIEGVGGGHTTDIGDYTRIGGTRLAWWGTSSDGGTPFTAFITMQATGTQALKHCSISHCWLDCRNNDQNQALFGLQVISVQGLRIDDFFIDDALAIGFKTDISSTVTEAADQTRWLMTDFCSRQIDNPPVAMITPILMTSAVVMTTTPQSLTVATNTLPTSGYLWTATTAGWPVLVNYTGGGGTTTLTGCTIAQSTVVHTPTTVNGGNVVQTVPGNGACIRFDGGTAANTCCAAILQAQLSHGTTWGPAALETQNSDSMEIISMYVNGGNATNDGVINRQRKPGVRVNGSIVSAGLSSRNMSFKGGSAGVGGLSCMGVTNAGVRLLAQSGPTYWDLYQLANAEVIPVVESNACLDWTPNGGIRPGKIGSTAIADQAISAATLTNINGSLIAVPTATFFQAGSVFRWKVMMTKTAAGTAARTFFVRLGTTGTTTDAVVATFTNAAVGTAAIGAALLEVILTIRTVPTPAGAGATAIAYSVLTPNGNTGFSTTGPNVTAGTMATFNTATAQQFFSLSVTSGASEAITVQQCIASCEASANP